MILEKEKYGTIQLGFNKIAHYAIYGKQNEEIIEREYHLSKGEEKIVRELRLPKYTQKNIIIDIRGDGTLRKMTISGIEEDLNRQGLLKETISPNGFVAPDNDFGLATKLVIEERFSLDKPIKDE